MMGWAIRAGRGLRGSTSRPATRLKTKWTAQLLLYRQLLAHEAGGGALRESRMAVVEAAGSKPNSFYFNKRGMGPER